MGTTHSSSVVKTPRRNDTSEITFNTLWAELTQTETICESDFVTKILTNQESLARNIFRFISLGNSTVSKSFMQSRVRDISGHAHVSPSAMGSYAAPFWTLVDAIGFTSRDIVQMACLDMTLEIESLSFNQLDSQYPNIEIILNASVNSVLFRQPHLLDGLIPNSSSLVKSQSMHRRLQLLLPSSAGHSPMILFNSQSGGMSFRVLVPAIKYYSGGILWLFESVSGEIFGCYADRTDWTDTKGFDESARDSFLFQISPSLRVRRPNRIGSRNFVYMNSTSTNPCGIGFGGREGSFRLWLDGSDLTKIRSMESDATFESGNLVDSVDEENQISIKTIEVWGYGGTEAVEKQRTMRETDESVRQDRRRVDKARLVENQFDREVLFANTFKNQESGAARLGSG
jgi:hypothetical protein